MSIAEETVRTRINFFDSANPTTKVAVLNGGKRNYEPHDVVVTNARRAAEQTGLDRSGFVLIRHESRVANFRDTSQIKTIYRDEVTALVKELTGADLVIAFHGHIRDNAVDVDPNVVRKPARSAHIDYVEETFRKYAEAGLKEIDENPAAWLRRRFCAFNIWRGLSPVEELPLAVCDARTVAPPMMHTVEVEERKGSNDGFKGMLLQYDAAQRWFYYPDMQPDEVLIFKQCDSDHSKPRWCPHTAIEVPQNRQPEMPRVSFDIRTIAFFDEVRPR